MMRPQFRRFIPGSAALMAYQLEAKLIAMIASNFASGNSSIGATNWIPALFTRMSTTPSAASASAIICRTASAFDRSAAE